MNSRYTISSLMALIAGLGFVHEAKALWCGAQGGSSNFDTPECPDTPGYNDGTNLGVMQTYEYDICEHYQNPSAAGFPVAGAIITYPDPAYYAGGKKFPLVVIAHGGALEDTFYDKHGTGAGGSHHVNPYQDIAMSMASKGAVVLTPVFERGTDSAVAGARLADVIGCFINRTTPWECLGNPYRTCINSLLWKVDSQITFVGHSQGAVMGLFLPEHFGFGIKALILMDPAKKDWTNALPTRLSQSYVPIVHLYPDYYGPALDANNEMFRLGFPKTCVGGTYNGNGCRKDADCQGGSCSNNTPPYVGPWVPLGIRELPTQIGGVNPNQLHHQVHHCTFLSSADSFEYLPGTGHEAFCDNGVSCTKPSVECGSSGQYCGPEQACISRLNRAYWSLGSNVVWEPSLSWIAQRYITAYSACFGADYGHYYQSWVNGMDRNYDDAGTGHSCTKNGYVDGTCGAHTDYASCTTDTANDCKWAMAQEKYCQGGTNDGAACYDGGLNCYGGGSCSGLGQVIRVNNGGLGIHDYGVPPAGDTRYYTNISHYDSGTGEFDEQTERLIKVPYVRYRIACGQMTAFF